MNSFELSPQPEHLVQQRGEPEGLGSAILLNNVRWFTHVRWAVVGVFALACVLCAAFDAELNVLGLHAPVRLTLGLAAALALANMLFCFAVRRIPSDAERHVVARHIWTQIIVDLIAVTVLVHFVGSTDTFISFTYLFHITLACIFLSPRNSLLVTLIATALYFGCVALEQHHVIAKTSIFLIPPIGHHHPEMAWLEPIYAMTSVFFWFLIWYLVSTFSKSVRDRDRQLDRANRKLLAADAEKNMVVMRTTHDLKAPFTGMEMQIQLLRRQHWNELSAPVREIMEKIMTRAATLRGRINDIITLGSLRAEEDADQSLEAVELDEVLSAAVLDVSDRAQHRGITIDKASTTATVYGDARQLHILFSNLVANAVFYSREGGTVQIAVDQSNERVGVRVSDRGIGIAPDALPHIFDEYYRTREAAQFNRMSTGLGLAIVRQIVENFRYTIRVDSEQDAGTTFEVLMPVKSA